MKDLKHYGWNDFFDNQFNMFNDNELCPARVAVEYKKNYLLYSSEGELDGELKRKYHHIAGDQSDLPKVGDWVLFKKSADNEKAVIHHILGRKSKLSRKVTGKRIEEHILATNMDYVLIVVGLDNDFNLRKLERLLVVVYESGADPIVVLNKSDLCINLEKKIEETSNVLIDVPLFVTSCVTDVGINELSSCFKQGMTYAFIGSSGTGKSTIINLLAGDEIQTTSEISGATGKGRHTTTQRELIILKNKSLIIDTPGLREIQLWSDFDSVVDAFIDIWEISGGCKFSDCTHTHEKNCAVKDAVANNQLSKERYENFVKMQKETVNFETRQTRSNYDERKIKMKKAQKQLNKIKKNYYKNFKTK
jgi:ribosome biogenesis GTPase